MAFCAPALRIGSGEDARTRLRTGTRRVRCSATSSGDHDLVIVGTGALGLRAARLWRDRHPDAEITCATRTETRHDDLKAAGFKPALSSTLSNASARVLFCAPPSGSKAGSYADDVRDAGALARTRFVFTSATSAFRDAAVITERSENAEGDRARRLLDAEDAALAATGGAVVRLGGLYDLNRGPHAFWLRKGVCSGGADGMLNMVHYDDAAAAAVAALEADGNVADGLRFVAVDGNPLTREELCAAARVHMNYASFDMPTFGEGGYIKRIDCTWTRETLQWAPRWNSFKEYFQVEAVKQTKVEING